MKAMQIMEKATSLLNEIKEVLYPILEKKGHKIEFTHNIAPASIVFDAEYGAFFLKVENRFDGRFEDAPMLLLSSIACEILLLDEMAKDN